MKMSNACIHHAKQSGQILVMSVIFLAVAVMAILLLFNIGQINTEKARLVNAADAAAYSGGLYFARNLNFLAYTNRAMIANHVAIGHFISYVSWVRYASSGFDNLNKVTRLIPYINTANEYTSEILKNTKEAAEKVAPILINTSEVLNNNIQNAQLKSQFTMNGVLSVSSLLDVKIMDKVAKTYHPTIRVNHKDDVEKVESEWIREQVVNDMAATLHYLKRYRPGNDKNRLNNMITRDYLKFETWIKGNRGWQLEGGGLSLYKEGHTRHVISNDKSDWQAHDNLRIERLSGGKKKGAEIASGQSSVHEFKPRYKGVPSYYDVRDRLTGNSSLKVTALATMSGAVSNTMIANGVRNESIRLQALSRAEIFYQRPEGGFTQLGHDVYANLYNPFWQVRMTHNNY